MAGEKSGTSFSSFIMEALSGIGIGGGAALLTGGPAGGLFWLRFACDEHHDIITNWDNVKSSISSFWGRH
jgi:hypothetical protein